MYIKYCGLGPHHRISLFAFYYEIGIPKEGIVCMRNRRGEMPRKIFIIAHGFCCSRELSIVARGPTPSYLSFCLLQKDIGIPKEGIVCMRKRRGEMPRKIFILTRGLCICNFLAPRFFHIIPRGY
jgi:hypothetical protein